MDKKKARIRRSRQARLRISALKVARLSIHKTNAHIYASIISPDARILVSASTLDSEVKDDLSSEIKVHFQDSSFRTSTSAAAAFVGKHVAKRALDIGVKSVAFDRSGFKYHGRVKALADAARSFGLKF